MRPRSVAARRFVLQALDRLLAEAADSSQNSDAAASRASNAAGPFALVSAATAGSRN
ncbi:hypothetical protein [Xaviernesmea oryzae]|uniref:hypothetical protein n=1 Tax=Xaviernesmea oryzae TaxID=464029 RepID=UPI0008D575C3|nr:hypothetical protein [Xaviernesmea oryzae]SEK58915.1 hypothetical protein SAMN04487976_10324 [Xaviernesmea oryzae]